MTPEFAPGDVVVKVDPCGHEATVGPLIVVGCVHLEDDFSLYVVETKIGDRSIADGIEMVDLAVWLTWTRGVAN